MIKVQRINVKCEIALNNIEELKAFTAKIEQVLDDEESEIYLRFEDTTVKFNPKLGTGPRSFET